MHSKWSFSASWIHFQPFLAFVNITCVYMCLFIWFLYIIFLVPLIILVYCQLFSTNATIKDLTLRHEIGFKYCSHYFVMGTEENSIWHQWNGNLLNYLCICSKCTVILPFELKEWFVISCKYENNKGHFNWEWSHDILIYRFYNRESHHFRLTQYKRGDNQDQRFECK